MDKTGRMCQIVMRTHNLAKAMTQTSDKSASGANVLGTGRPSQDHSVEQKTIVKTERSKIAESIVGDIFCAPEATNRRWVRYQLASIVAHSLARAVAGKPMLINPADLLKHWSPQFTSDEIGDLIVPKRTLARRVAKQEPLSLDEVDRAIRVGHVSVEAERVFCNPEKASRWLRRPNQTLNNQRPIDLLTSHAGVQVVLERLGQIDHGMFV